MRSHRKALIPLLAFALVAAVGTVVGMGITGAFSSDNPSSSDLDRVSAVPAQVVELTQTPASSESTAEPNSTPAPGGSVAEPTLAFISEDRRDSPTGVLVEPDPDFEEELRGSRLSTRGWKTDFSRHSVPFASIFSGGPPRRRDSAPGRSKVHDPR